MLFNGTRQCNIQIVDKNIFVKNLYFVLGFRVQ